MMTPIGFWVSVGLFFARASRLIGPHVLVWRPLFWSLILDACLIVAMMVVIFVGKSA
jgi:hypothetical protein